MTIQKSTLVIIVLVAIGGGFLLGMYREQAMAAITTALGGTAASTETIDTAALQQTYQKLLDNYDGTLDTQALIDGASRGLVAAAGDEYTTFMSAKEADEFSKSLEGSIGGGIGAQIGTRDNLITLVKIIDNTPAQAAGLRAGDRVLAINDEATAGWTVDKAVQKIRGEVDSTVKLSIRRESEEPRDVSITRKEIVAPSVESRKEGTVGIITLSRFDQNTGSQTRAAALKLKSEGMTSLILDVRGNPGGYVTAARDVASLWLQKGEPIVVERKGKMTIDEVKADGNPILADMPTVVLMDGNSASASEIVAGALKDYGKATLIGETTYGKGSVQAIVSLDRDAILKVTIARWYTPKGVNLSEHGIKPDKEVIPPREEYGTDADSQLQAALDHFGG